MKRIATVIAVTAVIAACEREPPADARAELCQEIAELDVALSNLATLPPTATVGQLREAREEVAEELADIREAATELREARLDQVEQAQERLEETFEQIPEDATVRQALSSVQSQVVAYRAAVAKLNSDIRCPTP